MKNSKLLAVLVGLSLLVGVYNVVQLVGQPHFGSAGPVNYDKQWQANSPFVLYQGATLRVGGDLASYQLNAIVVATSSLASTTLTSISNLNGGNGSSTTSSTVNFAFTGFTTSTAPQAGDPCIAGIVVTSSSQPAFPVAASTSILLSGYITTSTANLATATVILTNMASTTLTVPTSTVRLACLHFGV